MPHESLLDCSPRWLRCLVQRRHHSLGHHREIYLHEKRNGQHQVVKEGMGTTSRHLRCFDPEDTAKRQVPFYHDVAPHQRHICQKKRGIAKNLLLAVRTVMHQQQVDLVAGDFNGAAWRRQSGGDARSFSSIEEAFVNTSLPLPPGATPLGPSEWSDVCGFSKPLGSEHEWQVRTHGAFTIPYGMLGLMENRSKLPSRSLARDHSREIVYVILMTSHASICAVATVSYTPRLFRQGVR